MAPGVSPTGDNTAIDLATSDDARVVTEHMCFDMFPSQGERRSTCVDFREPETRVKLAWHTYVGRQSTAHPLR